MSLTTCNEVSWSCVGTSSGYIEVERKKKEKQVHNATFTSPRRGCQRLFLYIEGSSRVNSFIIINLIVMITITGKIKKRVTQSNIGIRNIGIRSYFLSTYWNRAV